MTQEISPTHLNASVTEVWRTLRQNQRTEIARYAADLWSGWCSFRVDRKKNGYVAPHYEERASKAFIAETNLLAEADLDIADRGNFPRLSPRRAMTLIRLARPIGVRLLDNSPHYSPSTVERCAVALTGLHMSILGAEHLIQSEAAQANLESTADRMYASSFEIFLR